MDGKSCIFCQIVYKKAPAFVVYEDTECLAFLDINPLALGHTLVIPKMHAENIFDIDQDALKHIIGVAKMVSEKMKEKLAVDGVDIFQASGEAAEQSVFHFHLHVIPRKKNDGLNIREWWAGKVKKTNQKELEEVMRLIKI
jgi:diadenosine tetraphosphate (Ap4A) HIT family hydrolase